MALEQQPVDPLDTLARHSFPSTRWTLVAAARQKEHPTERRALDELCRAYWLPIYAFLRRQGWSRHDAEDLTQGFFAGILTGDTLQQADPAAGRLRSLLLAELKKHIAAVTRAAHRQKRGGGAQVVSLDADWAEEWMQREPADQETPDHLFDRVWANNVLGQTRTRLREFYEAKGKRELFEVLEECLVWNDHETPYRELAARLNLGVPAVRLQVFRLRKKYRELLEAEIAGTVSSPEDFQKEIAHLREVLRGKS